MQEENKNLVQVDVNVERMPIVFFGSSKKRKELEKKIFESGKPYEIVSKVDEGRKRVVSVAPNAVYGLPTDFDQDVIVVALYYLNDMTNKLGACPAQIRIPLSDFPKIMGIKKCGSLYKQIEKSIERISGLEIYQEDFLQVKEKDGLLKIYDKKSLKFFNNGSIHKEEKTTRSGTRMRKHYIDLEISTWMRKNVDNYYTTDFDIKKYFEMKGGRVRKLYRFLEFIRYRNIVFVRFKKLYNELWISDNEEKLKKRTLKRTLDALIKDKFIKSYRFDNYGAIITFSTIKKRKQKKSDQFEILKPQHESLVQEIVKTLGDQKSVNYFRKIVPLCPEDMIYRCLSLTREAVELDGIKKSKGAIFIDTLKRECKKFDIIIL